MGQTVKQFFTKTAKVTVGNRTVEKENTGKLWVVKPKY